MSDVKSRPPLSRQRVLRAALALADAEGLGALTMRRLGQALGVEAMSLYNHVANKDEILDGILDLVAAEIQPCPAAPDEAADWRVAMRHRAVSAHDALLRHPWAGMLWIQTALGPARMRHMDAVLRTLREAEFPPALLDRAFHTLENHILGHALQQVSFPYDEEELAVVAAGFLQQLDGETYPDLADHVRWHLGQPGCDDEFEFGLDLILDGLERTRQASAGPTSPGPR